MHFLCFKGPDCAVLLTRVKAHRLQSDFSLRVDSPMRHFDINMDWQRNDDFWPNMNPKRNLYLISWWGRLFEREPLATNHFVCCECHNSVRCNAKEMGETSFIPAEKSFSF